MMRAKHLLWMGFIPSITMSSTPLNIIYIITDQQSATALSCAGNSDVKTPNIDRLAARGIRFENAYCSQPLSGPSRAAMFTGQIPGSVGLSKNNTPVSEDLKSQSLGILMNNAGYNCAYAGKWHVHTADIPDIEFGFDSIYPHNDTGLAEKCVTFLNQKHKKPFFLVASFDNPHNICEYARNQNLPFALIDEPQNLSECPGLPQNFAVQPYDADILDYTKLHNFNVHPTINYTSDDWRRYRYIYYRLVETVDAEIGKIVDAIDANNYWDNTIIIFSSDHGDGNGAHQWNQKTALYEEVVNVPLIACYPDKTNGEVMPQLINNGIDFMATVLDIAGLKSPENNKGVSFLNLMENPDDSTQHQDFIVTETLFYNGVTRGWMVRTKDYKYILYDRGKHREQLYDMNTDRGEMINLAIENRYKSLLNQHREILKKWLSANGISPLRPGLEHVPFN